MLTGYAVCQEEILDVTPGASEGLRLVRHSGRGALPIVPELHPLLPFSFHHPKTCPDMKLLCQVRISSIIPHERMIYRIIYSMGTNDVFSSGEQTHRRKRGGMAPFAVPPVDLH